MWGNVSSFWLWEFSLQIIIISVFEWPSMRRKGNYQDFLDLNYIQTELEKYNFNALNKTLEKIFASFIFSLMWAWGCQM